VWATATAESWRYANTSRLEIAMIRLFLAIGLVALIAGHAAADERRDYQNAMGMALPDSATGKLVFYDCGGERLLILPSMYPVSLAQETLCPDKVVLGDVAIRTGQHEAALLRKLGAASRVIEDTHQQSADSSIVYFRRLILSHPNTSYYYTLSQLQRLSGWFRVLEWDLPDSARLRVYLQSPERRGPRVAQLLELDLPRVPLDSVSFVPWRPDLLVRRGRPSVTWDLGRGILTVR
jgi:hypothetical protein